MKLQEINKNIREFFAANWVIVLAAFFFIFELLLINRDITASAASTIQLIKVLIMAGSVTFLIYGPLLLIKKKYKWGFFISLFLSVVFLVDVLYFRYYGSVPSVNLIESFGQTTDVLPAIVRLFKLSDILLFSVPTIYLAAWVYLKKRKASEVDYRKFLGVMSLVVIIAMSLIFYQDRADAFSIALNRAYDTRIAPQNYTVIVGHLFDIYRVVSDKFHHISKADKEKTIAEIKAKRTVLEKNKFTGIAKGKNVIMIQIEAGEGFLIDSKIEGQEITPNLNQLKNESYDFKNHYFTIGGGSTSDADFSANTSLYPMKDLSVFVKYAKRDYTGLAEELKKNGYSTSAYHANNKRFWNREEVFKKLGYENFYAADSFSKEPVVEMGLSDKVFYKEAVDYMKKQKKPSFSYLISLSSHFPFHLDDSLRSLKLTKGKYTDLVSGYLAAARYADEALGELVADLKKEGLWDDSLVLLYGDHLAKIESFDLDNRHVDMTDSSGINVPMLIKLPGQKNGKEVTTPTSHLDIMPTILNLTGTTTTSIMLGRDMFGASEANFNTLFFYDTDTIVRGKYRLRIGTFGQKCEYLKGLTYYATDAKNCSGFLDDKTKTEQASSNLIKYNLFSSFK